MKEFDNEAAQQGRALGAPVRLSDRDLRQRLESAHVATQSPSNTCADAASGVEASAGYADQARDGVLRGVAGMVDVTLDGSYAIYNGPRTVADLDDWLKDAFRVVQGPARAWYTSHFGPYHGPAEGAAPGFSGGEKRSYTVYGFGFKRRAGDPKITPADREGDELAEVQVVRQLYEALQALHKSTGQLRPYLVLRCGLEVAHNTAPVFEAEGFITTEAVEGGMAKVPDKGWAADYLTGAFRPIARWERYTKATIRCDIPQAKINLSNGSYHDGMPFTYSADARL